MKKFFIFCTLLAFVSAHAQNNAVSIKAKTFSAKEKKVTIYTTAENTDYRLTETGTASFSHMGQPFETQVCVFVDPDKTFQTILGIGGALTDAAAETYAKLPKDKPDEGMRAYYCPANDSGYTLGRTNSQSGEFSSGSYSYVKDGDK